MSVLNVIQNKRIEWSISDTFELMVTDDSNFTDGDTLKFEIAKNETSDMIISNTYELNNGEFNVVLSEADRKKIELGDYIYRIIITSANGSVKTEQSGDFIAKWGV